MTRVLDFRLDCIDSPQAVFSQGLSDHSPMVLTVSVCKRAMGRRCAIPTWVAKHALFKKWLPGFLDDVDLDSLTTGNRLSEIKRLSFEVAGMVLRDYGSAFTRRYDVAALRRPFCRMIWVLRRP